MIALEDVHAHYGKSHILQGVNMIVNEGESVALLGRNGVGKTTTMKSIMGLIRLSGGSVVFNDVRIDKIAPHKIPGLGLGLVPQGRRIFPNLTVYENLCLGLPGHPPADDLAHIFDRFPRIKERLRQRGGTLSGGELQMLALARCLVMKPRLLLLDEPTEGLMPLLVATIRDEIKAINKTGVTVLLVEQNVRTALSVCKRIYIMEKGVIVYEGTSQELRNKPETIHRFLGVNL